MLYLLCRCLVDIANVVDAALLLALRHLPTTKGKNTPVSLEDEEAFDIRTMGLLLLYECNILQVQLRPRGTSVRNKILVRTYSCTKFMLVDW